MRGPRRALAHYNLARVLVKQGELDAAIEGYRRASALDPADAKIWNNLGSALVRAGRFAEAETPLGRALNIAPGHRGALFNLGALQLERGDLAEGRALGARFLEVDAQDAASRSRLALLVAERGDRTTALRWLEAAPAPDAEAHGLEAFLLWGQGRERADVAAAEVASSLASGSTVHRKNLAWMLATAQDGGVRDGERALRLVPEATLASDSSASPAPELLDVLATAAAATGDFELVRDSIAQALDRARERGRSELVPVFEARKTGYDAERPHRRRGPSPIQD